MVLTGCGWWDPAPAPVRPTDMMRALGYVEEPAPSPADCGVLSTTPQGAAGPTLRVWGLDGRPRVLAPDGTVRPDTDWTGPGHLIRTRAWGSGGRAVLDPQGVVHRTTAAGEIAWSRPLRGHHDLEPRGSTLAVLTASAAERETPVGRLTVVDDAVTVLDARGQVVRTLSVTERFLDDVYPHMWPDVKAASWSGRLDGEDLPGKRDLLHTNSLERIEVARGSCEVGDHLILLRNLSELACLSPEGDVHWRWSERALQAPHDARQRPDGTLSVFDNGVHRGWSRVVVVDPAQNAITWSFGGPDVGLFSRVLGEAQWLDDGSLLITASTTREVWRVSPEGQVWWRWRACPDLGNGEIHEVEVVDPSGQEDP